ncbi:MAG: glycosyltransferase family A protein [Opitutaceae bacterium]|jgi:glycosyltransferase involved in cell wall biosynthesis
MTPATMPPLVSILIPCHNAARWVSETLDSALAQTWPRTEVIVVDDGSRDDSAAIIARYADRGVKLIPQPNRGAGAARNAALAAAKGDFVQFLDADDLIAPDKIALQMQRLITASPRHIASGEWARFTDDPAKAGFVPEPSWRDLSGLEFQLLHYESGWMMQPAAWLCPRALLDEAGPWDETLSLNDDGEYFSRVMLASAGILFCPGSRTYYRSGVAGSLSRRVDPAALRSLWKSNELNCDRLLAAAGRSPRAKNAAANGWQRIAFLVYPALPALADEAEARMRALGGTTCPMPVGPTVRRLARVTGWRLARRIHDRMLHRAKKS